MKVQVEKNDDGSRCTVRIGPVGRSDPDSQVHVVKKVGERWERIKRQYVEGAKAMHFDLAKGEYHVAVFGEKIAGVATTAGHDLPYPWNVFLDPPEDHSRDFMRLDIPANVPLTGDLERSVRAALKQ